MTEAAREIARPLPAGRLGQLLRGVGYPFRALGFIGRHKLWGPCLWPILISLVLLVGLITASVLYAGDLRDLLWSRPAGEGFVNALLLGLWHALAVVLGLLLIVVDILLFALLGRAIASPFLDLLAERVERLVGLPLPAGGLRATLRSVLFAFADVLLIIVFYLALLVPLLLLNLIPVVGSAAYTVLSTALAMLMLALDFSSLTLARRLVPFLLRWQAIWLNRWLCLGFGAAVFVLLLVPVLNLVLLPLAAVGATLLVHDLYAGDRLPEPVRRALAQPR